MLVMLVVRFLFWIWCLPFALVLAVRTRVDLHLVIICVCSIPADTVEDAPKFREEKHDSNKAV